MMTEHDDEGAGDGQLFDPRVMSRRSALKTGLVGLALLGLAGSATQVVRMASKSAPKPAAKTQLAVADIPRDIKDWPSLDALGDGMVKRKLTPGLSLSVMRDGTLIYS